MAYSRLPSGDDKLISRFERLRKCPKDGWPPWTDRPGSLRIVLNADDRVDAVRSWSAPLQVSFSFGRIASKPA